MKLFEYEGKMIFQEENIKLPESAVCSSVEEAEAGYRRLGPEVVIKCQVLQGGRGKSGGVLFAANAGEARQIAGRFLAEGLNGEAVHRVLLEQKVSINKELYLALSFDPKTFSPIVLASVAGGMDIEQIAVETPQLLVRTPIDLFTGMAPFLGRKIAQDLNLNEEQIPKFIDLLAKLYSIYTVYDAELVEINPLVITNDDDFLALDSKVIINDNALFRQTRFVNSEDRFGSAFEYRASQYGLNYVKLGGNIGVLCTGAGLTMTTLDLIDYYHGKAANFLEFGGATYKNAQLALSLVTSDPDVEVILINTFGLVARADVISEGLVEAIKTLQPKVPIVCSIRGTGENEAREKLRAIGLTPLPSAEEAVRQAVQLAGGPRHD